MLPRPNFAQSQSIQQSVLTEREDCIFSEEMKNWMIELGTTNPLCLGAYGNIIEEVFLPPPTTKIQTSVSSSLHLSHIYTNYSGII